MGGARLTGEPVESECHLASYWASSLVPRLFMYPGNEASIQDVGVRFLNDDKNALEKNKLCLHSQ